MKRRVIMMAASAAIIQSSSAYCCSPAEMVQKQKAFAQATKAAFDRDPGGDAARQAKVRLVIARYSELKNSTNGSYIIDMTCKENDELLAIYK
ncbi:MAG: hypothetical protein JOZ74_11215 [Bradyrhizobium sp.]|nr:hypothetical protein [Bradyrhizobium sp.]